MLPKIGGARNIIFAYRYALKYIKALTPYKIQIAQFTEKTKRFIFHANQNTQTRKSIKANLESLHLFIDINTLLFDLSYNKYGFLSVSYWLTDLW